MSGDATARKLQNALAMAGTLFPNAAPVLAAMDVRLDDRVGTAAVTPSGRMLVSPAFFGPLTLHEAVFVVAHELYHVLYGVFDRFDRKTPPHRRRLVNIAHDFLVNDMLEEKFRAEDFRDLGRKRAGDGPHGPSRSSFIPAGALFWPDYADTWESIAGRKQPPLHSFSLESLVLALESLRDELPSGSIAPLFAGGHGRKEGNLGDRLDRACCEADGEGPSSGGMQRLGSTPELMTEEEEAALFPGETAVERKERRDRLEREAELETARREVPEAFRALDELKKSSRSRGVSPGDGDAVVRALSGVWETPWERALQKWMDDTAPPVRSWAKASRRTGDRTDVVLPGRLKDGFILHVVVDTSGSMVSDLPAVFGMIQSFGRTSGVRAARILQCDTAVSADDIVDIDDLADFRVKGFGGSNMSPALLRLAEDPTVEAAIVLTDGYIGYPPKEAVPFDVLWCLSGSASSFHPGYGTVLSIPRNPLKP